MKVSIGRIVLITHVVKGEHKSLPAIVVMTHDNDAQAIDVQMFSDSFDIGNSFLAEVRHESSKAVDPFTDIFWIWPPRET